MKSLFILISALVVFNNTGWLTNFEEARKIAEEKNRFILLNFSGSDWCGPCMRMRKEIFESTDFKTFSDTHLVLLNADFPRNKKNRLSKEQQIHNDKLADKYNAAGKFPLTILLDAQGNLVKEWDGLPDLKPAEFVNEIERISDSRK